MEKNLLTSRLMMVPFTRQDLNLLHGMFTDPFVRKYLWDDEIIPLERSQEILRTNEELFEREGWGIWKVCLQSEKIPIGFTGLWHFFNEPQPQLLYGLLPSHIGQGYATEAAGAVIEYAFRVLNFTYILAAMDPPHLASQHVAERLGMTRIDKHELEGKETVFYRKKRKRVSKKKKSLEIPPPHAQNIG